MLYLFWFENKLQAACDIDSEPPKDLSYKYHRVENCSRTKCECLPRHFINKSIAMIARFFFYCWIAYTNNTIDNTIDRKFAGTDELCRYRRILLYYNILK